MQVVCPSTDVTTSVVELSYHGAKAVNTIKFTSEGANFFNATSPIMNFGVKYAPKLMSRGVRAAGYDGIIYNSLRASGTNVVQFSNFWYINKGPFISLTWRR